jgi:hypothetical protein
MRRNDSAPAGDDAPDLSEPRRADLVAAAAFALLGAFVLWESSGMQWLGAVTPQFVGAGLISLSALLGGRALASRAWRRIGAAKAPLNASQALFVLIFAGWIAALPWLGFIASSFLGFVAISFATPRLAAMSPAWIGWQLAGAMTATVAAWALLARVLDIPLPVGAFMRGLSS